MELAENYIENVDTW